MNLNEESLTSAVHEMVAYGLSFEFKPRYAAVHLVVGQKVMRDALKMLFYQPPIKKVNGLRKRKKALYWRKK